MTICARSTCGHDATQHSGLAGCLAVEGTTYCPCPVLLDPVAMPEGARRLGQVAGRVRANQAAVVQDFASGLAQGLQEGRQRRDEGMEAAGSNVAGPIASAWRSKAAEALATLAATGDEFSADDLVAIAGEPPVPNMLGPLFAKAARQDVIRAVGFTQGTRPKAHARVQRTWKGA